jgi:hypothetical protein
VNALEVASTRSRLLLRRRRTGGNCAELNS